MVLAILQARVSSSRLPGKVLLPVLERPMLFRQTERLRHSGKISSLVIATSCEASDDPLAAACLEWNIPVVRGDLEDVLARFMKAVDTAGNGSDTQAVVRLTGDCPLCDWRVIDQTIELFQTSGADYVNNTDPPTWPDGLDVEVMKAGALRYAFRNATLPSEREHVTPYLRTHPELFSRATLKNTQDLSSLRWTVDEPEDFLFVTEVYKHLYPQNHDFSSNDIIDFLKTHPELSAGNSHFIRNEGFLKSLHLDKQQIQTKG